MAKIALVGAGNMGFAMLRTWARLGQHDVAVVEPHDALRARAAGAGVKAYASPDDIPPGYRPDAVVIATKPQMVGDVVERYTDLLQADGVFLSVAAGVGIEQMAMRAGRPVAIIRCMPNTPAAIGEGMIVCCPGENAGSEHRALAEQLLSAVGRVAFIEKEAMMDAVTAVSGSGPAYVFYFIEALCTAGIRAGLDDELALLLAKQTVLGAARLVMESSEEPSTLREQVTSPNGTTAAALHVLMNGESGLLPLVDGAVTAAKRRSVELGQ